MISISEILFINDILESCIKIFENFNNKSKFEGHRKLFYIFFFETKNLNFSFFRYFKGGKL